MKKLFATLSLIFIIVSALSAVSLAVDPYTQYKMSSTAPFYMNSSGSSSYGNITKGKRVTGTAASNTGWSFNSTRTCAVYNNNTGYLVNQTIIPLYRSYVVSSSNTKLTQPNGNEINLDQYSYICKYSESGSNYYVRAYLSSGGTLMGYVPSSKVSIDYGY